MAGRVALTCSGWIEQGMHAMLPALFLSHGAPTLPLTQVAARAYLAGLGAAIDARHGRPNGIVVASAHWETASPSVNTAPVQPTIHDFFGFPPALYAMRYPAPGPRPLADQVAGLLSAAGMPAGVETDRGLDHGAWVPLSLMYPAADIPVVQVSIQPHLGPALHLALGQALAPLREQGVLVIGSGSYTHDLSEFRNHRDVDAAEPDWVRAFADWMDAALLAGRMDDLLAYRRLAPFAVKNHPTDEHLLPLYVALGAGGAPVAHLHESTMHGILRMDVYGFG